MACQKLNKFQLIQLNLLDSSSSSSSASSSSTSTSPYFFPPSNCSTSSRLIIRQLNRISKTNIWKKATEDLFYFTGSTSSLGKMVCAHLKKYDINVDNGAIDSESDSYSCVVHSPKLSILKKIPALDILIIEHPTRMRK